MLHTVLDRTAAPHSGMSFAYEEAFSRTLGWITASEQQRLRLARVAIAGLGGVGGAHAQTLARLGIGKFRLADFDRFELPNFNRQFGAVVSNIGRLKTGVISAAVSDINPEAEIDVWEKELKPEEAAAFLTGADIYIDAMDFYALEVRRALFAAARAQGIPAVTAAPIGMGVAWLTFVPDGLSCDDYFGFSGANDEADYARFLMGLAPRGLHRSSLLDPSRIDFENRKAPSTPMGCMLCAGVAATEALKLLLGRAGVKPAPWFHQFDVAAGRFVSRRGWFGARNPMRQLKLALAHRPAKAAAPAPAAAQPAPKVQSLAEQVIDLARWAPSGDNEQPWRFSIMDDTRFRVLIRPANPDNPYEFARGRPVWLAAGGLLEAVSLAANRLNASASIGPLPLDDAASKGLTLQYDVELRPGAVQEIDPLCRFLETRSVDRTSYQLRRLNAREKAALRAALPDGMALRLFETTGERLAVARLNSDATVLRMRMAQTYPVHQRAFRFDSDQPEYGLPMGSVPLDAASRRLLKWILKTPKRSAFFNRALAGARLASIQTDILPGLACSAHFALVTEIPLSGAREEWVEAGRAMLRFWLMAENLGLVLQPSFAPLNFGHSARHGGIDFTASERRRAESLARRLENSLGDLNSIVFLGRIGQPRKLLRPVRSHRLPLDDLISL